MNPTQGEKAEKLKALHEAPGIFAIPNPWDAGSTHILTHLGFEALATTSAGLAFSLAKPDGTGAVTRDENLANARIIVEATHLPVAGDLENGYGDEPEVCAETIRLAAAAGLVGGSIEDASEDPAAPIYPVDLAVRRVQAAVKAARQLSFPFALAARAENFLHGRPDLDDTIRRLQAFAEAGADILFAPGLTTAEQISAVVRAVAPRPVNVVMGLGKGDFTLGQLAALGVRRVSLGSTLARAAYGPFWQAAEEIRQKGSFSFAKNITRYGEFQKLFGS
ncbi:MAG TPA: isocitrate lyase/phosphoenolpyruvate mutase family protein [Puia sp.]|uniref:isocitrate lyase/PEP mutase family protein n=1 Tax=Puia sp. TaxID=2045100 RepID=UPI002BB70E20|nr:isocitrate lyase/phosphoenolpyruvate mutase family protein [Puia sp.]HVU96937.1 isocitrate lyase/phosphoenolpyruvate mutase family protein [Puia sp.]